MIGIITGEHIDQQRLMVVAGPLSRGVNMTSCNIYVTTRGGAKTGDDNPHLEDKHEIPPINSPQVENLEEELEGDSDEDIIEVTNQEDPGRVPEMPGRQADSRDPGRAQTDSQSQPGEPRVLPLKWEKYIHQAKLGVDYGIAPKTGVIPGQ